MNGPVQAQSHHFSDSLRPARRRQLLLCSLLVSLVLFGVGFVPLQTSVTEWCFKNGSMDQRMNAEAYLIRQGVKSHLFFLECLNHENPIVRSLSLHALGQIQNRAVVDKVIEKLESPDEVRTVHQAAALALGALRDPRGGPALMEALDGDYPFLRFFAGLSLSRITGKGFGTDRPAWEEWWRGQTQLPPLPERIRPPGSIFLKSPQELVGLRFYKAVHGTAQDSIPAIQKPQWIAKDSPVMRRDLLDSRTIVFGIPDPTGPKAFVKKILEHHQVVNFRMNGRSCVLFQCPLGGFASAYYAGLDGLKFTFGVSGYLKNGTLVAYDQQSESFWNPIDGICLQGPRKGLQLERVPLVHCHWGAWLERYPDSKLLSPNSYRKGIYSSRYVMPLYEGQKESNRFFSPLDYEYPGNFVQPKELVLGYVSGSVCRAYPTSVIAKYGGVIKDRLDNTEVIIQWDSRKQLLIARASDGTLLPMVPVYWFAWYAYHPETEIYGFPEGG